MGEFYFGLACLWAILILVGFAILGPATKRLIALVQEPFLLAFSTASSEAAYPKMLEQLAKFPISRKISSFVLPLGYSFNRDGTMMDCTFASVFIAQAYDIQLSLGTQIAMLLTLMLTSKGVAGVPRASLVVIAATLSQFKLPEEGLLLIRGIDTFLDMGRSATNVIGNSLATAVVAKWEGQLVTDTDTALTIADMEGARVTRLLALALAASCAASAWAPARAEEGAALTGTLKTIAARGTILIGTRDSTIPFSFLNKGRQPVGFSIDL